MADQSEEIKHLFSTLALNRSQYQQTLAATAVHAVDSTLLQAAAAAQQSEIMAATPASILAAATPAPCQPLPPDDWSLDDLSAALRGAAQDIVRDEAAAQPELEAYAAASSTLTSTLSQPSPAEGLQSLFQSVKQSQAPMSPPRWQHHAPTERAAVGLPGDALKRVKYRAASAELPVRQHRETTSTQQRWRRERAVPRAASEWEVRPVVMHQLDPQTVPMTSMRSPSAAEGHLRLTWPTPAAELASDESLAAVFRRLSRTEHG